MASGAGGAPEPGKGYGGGGKGASKGGKDCCGGGKGAADDDDYDSDGSSYEDDSSDDPCCQDGDDQEKSHFLDVCWSFMKYQKDAGHDVERIQEAIDALDARDLELWQGDHAQWIEEVRKRVQVNANFLSLLPSPDVCGCELGDDRDLVVRQVPQGHRIQSRNSSKVRSTLRQFVRDWAVEGQAERLASYGPLMEALFERMPADPSGRPMGGQGRNGAPHVLCPGCGLGRLPYDLARLGYDAQGNEFSYHMLLGSHLILNRCTKANVFTIYPFILSTSNRSGASDHLRPVKIPEYCPRDHLPETATLSMTAGEFVEVYKDQPGEWDAVLTAFFLDTAKNVFLYIRTLAMLIREGGLWINLGPLLYHYADVEHEISIELSWEEVKPVIQRYFTIEEENFRLAHYTSNPGNMMSVAYRCVFFVATRNNEPITGVSNPVFSS